MALFDDIIGFKNLHRAYLAAKKNKRYRFAILEFGFHLENNLLELRKELVGKTYKHGGYREFVVTDSKKRIIKAAPFRDRVIHHAVCDTIEPIFERGFIYDSYACRKEKGVHMAIKRLEKFIRSLCFNSRERERETAPRREKNYCLKCDISKYFGSINHAILLRQLSRKISDKNILWLLDEIIKSNPVGIPIGNLTSQLFANIYLNELDHFIKRELHEKYYVRYMDDFLILNRDKKRLNLIKEQIKIFLRDRLNLELHPKKAQIFPIEKGIDFLGYVVKDGYCLLRKSTIKRFLKKRKQYMAMLKNGKLSEKTVQNIHASWRGYAKFADSYKLMEELGLNK